MVELSKETNNREESITNLRDCLENDLPKLQEAIRMEQAEREDYDTNFMKFVTEEMQKYSLHTNQFLNS
jgi:hypothetical protein